MRSSLISKWKEKPPFFMKTLSLFFPKCLEPSKILARSTMAKKKMKFHSCLVFLLKNSWERGAKPCRIMWSQRDPTLRRSGVGNIFVKNLNESIDNKQLYDTFSLFGNILSCKVVIDRETLKSKGYGYVHYETAEAAHAAIEKLDGMLIDGQEVQVGEFMRRNDRPGQSDWTNCYVKNIPFAWDDAKLFEEFSKFGEVVSAAISQGIPRRKAKKKAAPKEEETPEVEKKEGEDVVADEVEADTSEPVEETVPEVEEKVEETVDAVEEETDSKKPQSLG